ncbi:hypothetical protein [Ferruginivarius sediminum]|nr:hypothetical protein [Ferruginivarius sediminum]
MAEALGDHGFDVHDLGNPDSIEIGDDPSLRRAGEIDDKQVEVMGLEMVRHWLTPRLAGE